MDMFDKGGALFDLDAAHEHPARDWVELQSLSPDDRPRDEPAPGAYLPPHDDAVSGRELRHRLITPEVLAAMVTEEPKLSLLQRLLKRK